MSAPSPATPDSHGTALAEAWALFDRKAWQAAAASFRRDEQPSSTATVGAIEAAFGLAHACFHLGDFAAARSVLEFALAAANDNPDVRLALVRSWTPRSSGGWAINVAKLGMDKPDAASRTAPHLRMLALIYELAGDLAGTLLVYYALRTIDPGDTAILVKIGRLWMAGQNHEKAQSFLQKALVRDDRCIAALDGLADIAWIDGDAERVRTILNKRATLTSELSERTAVGFKAEAVQPVLAMDDAEIDAARARFSKMLAAGPSVPLADPWKLTLGPNFYLSYQGRNDRALQEAAAAFYLAATPGLGEIAPHTQRRRSSGKYRLGLISNYFTTHTIGYLNRGLVLGVDRNRFDVVLFRTPGARFDAATQEMAATARIVDLPPDLPAARRIIAEAAPDILHYPEIGMDYFSYFLAFARLAKVQTVSWGHPVTTGIPNIDIFLSVDAMEPPDGESHYSERLARLKHLSIDVARPVLMGTRLAHAELGLEADRPAYVCAQSLFKVHHAFDDTLRRILERDPKGIIYFVSHGPYSDTRFLERLGRRLGSDIARIRLLPRVTPETFLHLLHAADVLLDVPQWSGGRTSLEGFAVGTPIVHQPGEFMRGRHTLAFYRRMGLTATVADGPDSYADIAVRLVHDLEFRRDVRSQIAAHNARLFDDRQAVREIEGVWIDALENSQ